jgi:hypothetical protein
MEKTMFATLPICGPGVNRRQPHPDFWAHLPIHGKAGWESGAPFGKPPEPPPIGKSVANPVRFTLSAD